MRIEKLVFGGEGLARIDGEVLFVPFSAPGELVRVRVARIERRCVRAELVEVLEAAPTRREPPCAHFGTCGGCQLQHLEYATQLEVKRGFVREALWRIGGIEWSAAIEMHSGAELGTRSRVQWLVGPWADGARPVGYRGARSHALVPVERCPVLEAELEVELEAVKHTRELSAGEVDALAGQAGPDGKSVAQRIGAFEYRFALDGFAQSNRALSGKLVELAVNGARGTLAFDLYCGAGLFSLPLSRAFERVDAVESHAPSAALGEANARANDSINVHFHAREVERWLADRAGEAPDFVLLDPPRAGAGERVVSALADLGPQSIRYVSCDPTTLARDLRVLVTRGYALKRVSVIDLFPQTYHVESMVELAREAST